MTLRLATLCTFLAGPAAFAQMTIPQLAITRIDDPNADTYTFGAAECNDAIVLRWSNTLTTLSQCGVNPLKLWSTAGECGDTPGAADTVYDEVQGIQWLAMPQGTFTVEISELPDFKTVPADGGIPCGAAVPFSKQHKVCGAIVYGNAIGNCVSMLTAKANSFKLVYDTVPPNPPTVGESSAQDKAVRVAFTVGSDTDVVLIEVKGPSDLDFREAGESAASNNYIRAEGLENNVTYDVRLRARDAAGNVSVPTDPPIQLTPVLTLGFWARYKLAGGTDPGNGCSTGAGLMPLLLGVFALRRARKQVRREP